MKRAVSTIIGALAAGASAQDCLIQSFRMEIDLEHSGVGAAEILHAFDPPIDSLRGTLVSLGASVGTGYATGSGTFTTFLTAELLAAGAVVGSAGPMDALTLHTPVAPLHGGIVRLPLVVQTTPAARIDRIRLVLDNRVQAGDPDMTFTWTGLGGKSEISIIVWPGLLAEGRSPHSIVEFPGEPEIVLTAPEVSEWRELTLPEPAPLAGAAEILTNVWRFTSYSDGLSAMVEVHLELDDGSRLILDDAFSPSIGAPPPQGANLRALNCSRSLDRAMQEAITDRSVTKLWYRGHLAGTAGAEALFTPFGPVTLYIGRCKWHCYADADGSGDLDALDVEAFQTEFQAGHPAADCDGSGTLDFLDCLCFQNAFAAGCP